MKRTFAALATTVSVAVDDDVPSDLASMLIAGYPEVEEQPTLSFHLRGGASPALVCVGRYETAVDHIADLVPLFELDLYHALVEHAPPGWVLHAAAVERDGRAIVLAGLSGAGKTTLTLALLARGWRMATDEIVHISRDATIRGLARPIHSPTASAHSIPPEWARLPYPLRGHRGNAGWLVEPAVAVRTTSPLPLHVLARIEHGSDRAPALELLPPSRALPRLWECTLRRDDDGLVIATTMLGSIRSFDLASSAVEQAVALVERVANI
jgi:hypothetical protein